MSELSPARIPDAPAIQRLPLLQLILVGLQHVLLMYGGAIAVPLIIGQAAGLNREEIAFLINADLLVAGIATIVQSLGIGPMGIRMPVMMGASFAAVGSMVAMAGMPGIGLQGIFGATIAAGFFGMLIAPFMSKVVRFFPPLVTGTVITSIGLSLFPVAVNWAGGGAGRRSIRLTDLPDHRRLGAGHHPVGPPFHARLLGQHFRADRHVPGLCALWRAGHGRPRRHGPGAMAAIVTPLHFGMPKFELAPILSMCLVVVIIFVESTGMFLGPGQDHRPEVCPRMLRRGLLCDAGASFFAGFFNTFTHSSFAQNIGLVQMTGVRCRSVNHRCRWLADRAEPHLVPKRLPGGSIPPAVLGGAAIAMFGMVAATGIKILQ